MWVWETECHHELCNQLYLFLHAEALWTSTAQPSMYFSLKGMLIHVPILYVSHLCGNVSFILSNLWKLISQETGCLELFLTREGCVTDSFNGENFILILKLTFWVSEIAQIVKYLHCKPKNPSSRPRTYFKKIAGHDCTFVQILLLERQR